jgi:hypothetical protein
MIRKILLKATALRQTIAAFGSSAFPTNKLTKITGKGYSKNQNAR